MKKRLKLRRAVLAVLLAIGFIACHNTVPAVAQAVPVAAVREVPVWVQLRKMPLQ